jgi:hypothetical protein
MLDRVSDIGFGGGLYVFVQGLALVVFGGLVTLAAVVWAVLRCHRLGHRLAGDPAMSVAVFGAVSALLGAGMAAVAELTSNEGGKALDRVGLHLLAATLAVAWLAGWAHRRVQRGEFA